MTEEAELAPSWMMKGVPEGGALEEKRLQKQSKASMRRPPSGHRE